MHFLQRGLLCSLVMSLAAPIWAQDSLHVTALGHQDLYAAYSDIWGYETSSGRELALIGTTGGTSIVDVTDPADPDELSFIPGVASQWRDIKTHSTYAYIVTEGPNGGMQIVDLESDPPALVGAPYSVNFTTAHNIAISDGVAYIIGARNSGAFAGIRFVSLADPINPVEVGSFTGFYAHDCVVRADTMYAAAINSNFLGVVDVTDKVNPVTVATWTWEGNNAHNCDVSTDGRYVLTTDELTGGDLHIFDISDLEDVQQVATWTANPDAIIHNVHVDGDLAYITYYTEGLRILDIANPEFPVEVGFYDTFPGVSGGFNGAWGAYPYTTSGNIFVSDINSGLYILDFELLTGAVQGTVREMGSGPEIPGAAVQILGGASVFSNSSGFYKLFDDPGSVTLATTSYGFEPDTSQVMLIMGNSVGLDIELQRLPSTAVVGTVTNAFDSLPIESVSLVVESTPLTSNSDAGGLFSFPHVPYGVYKLSVSRFGFAPESRTISVTSIDPAQSLAFDFELEPAALSEDFESGPAGWSVGSADDDATSGFWVWSDPVGSGGGTVQPEDDHTPSGTVCWVTGNAASPSSSIGTADVDNGQTTLTTPVFSVLGMANPTISYWRWFSNDAGPPAAPDTLRVDISSNGGVDWVSVEKAIDSQQWTEVSVQVADYVAPSSFMRMRFIAEDIGAFSTVEAAIDDFMAFDTAVTDATAPRHVNRLFVNVPNPFNPSTRIRFAVAQAGAVALRIYDVRGRAIRTLHTGRVDAGVHERIWDGRNDQGRSVASGVYVYRLVAPGYQAARHMLLIK